MSPHADGVDLAGDFRAPRNMAASQRGSIHDDATASSLGFRGGTVAGSIHMDQFPPLLTRLFGEAWLGTGNLSLYFKQATVDQEPVRAMAKLKAGERQARLCMVNKAGAQVCEGTAACGAPDHDSELANRMKVQDRPEPGALRILRNLRLGHMGDPTTVRLAAPSLDERLETITEALPAYRGEGVWPGRVLSPSCCVQLGSDAPRKWLAEALASPAVGLYGAIELQFLGGPLLADTDYVSRGDILTLSESPKTENVWYRTSLSDPVTGREVAQMIQYLRFMKASSPLYA